MHKDPIPSRYTEYNIQNDNKAKLLNVHLITIVTPLTVITLVVIQQLKLLT